MRTWGCWRLEVGGWKLEVGGCGDGLGVQALKREILTTNYKLPYLNSRFFGDNLLFLRSYSNFGWCGIPI